jgi:hypothetical protein
MRQCTAITAKGERCTLPANGQQEGLCWTHDPANASRRRHTASRGGKAKAAKEVRDLKAEIRDVITNVKAGDLDRNDAAVMIQAYRALLEYIKLERSVVLEDDLAARIEELQRGQRPHAS